jgi:hypothetical protein
MTSTGTPYPPCGAASYWEPVRQRGRRYRAIDDAESEAMRRHLGAGRGRPALDAAGQEPPKSWDAGAADVELLTARWSRVRVSELEPSFRCYAPRP